MLFLAVFCGYLVEEYREKQQEKELAQTYLKALDEDVYRDSLQLNQLEEYCRAAMLENDTILAEIKSRRIITDSRHAFAQFKKSTSWDDFSPNDGTLQQLKHSGALRTIQNKEIVDKLMAYQATHWRLRVHEDMANFDLSSLRSLRRFFDITKLTDTLLLKPVPLLVSDKSTLSLIFERIYAYRTIENSLLLDYEKVKKAGSELKLAIRKHHSEF